MSQDKSARTEQPTAKKLQDARAKGNVPRSSELSGVFVLTMFLIFCKLLGSRWLEQMRGLLGETLSNVSIGELTPTEWLHTVAAFGSTTAQLLFLPVGLLAVASVTGNLLQGPPPFTMKPLTPDLNRLNPIRGLGKVFSLKSLVNLAKALTKMVLFTIIAVDAVRDAMLEGLPGAPGVEGAMAAIFAISGKVLFRVILLWALLAIIDLLWSRYDYVRGLRMTKQEIKDERKQMEGDPRVRARIKSKQLEMARARMMSEVPQATVVITNPTHYAVAIRYVPGEMDAPRVLAKGQALIAQRIREIAEEHRIPIFRDPPLARSLYRSVPVGSFIPETLFRAVAEVLALVLKRR